MRSRTTAACRRLAGSASPRPRSALMRRAGLLLGLALLMTASGAQAAILTVSTKEDLKSPPACTKGNCTLRAAIALANSDSGNDTILIPAGEYELSEAAGGQLPITASMTLAGAGARVTTIRAATNSQIFVVSAGTVALDDLTLTGAKVEKDGGAVQAEGTASLTIERDIVTNNHLLGENDGGGIHSEGELVSVLIDSSTVSGNSAHGGAGVDGSGPFTVVNSTLTGNEVVEQGAAMEVERATLINDTISGNECAGGEGCGGGVRFLGEPSTPQESTMQDTIIAGNTDNLGHVDNCLGNPVAKGPNLENGTLVNVTECKFGFSIEGAAPLLGPLTDNGGPTPTMLLGAGSPAIEAGTNETCAKQDQRGEARPATAGAQCDIGAVEVTPLADLAISGQASPASVALGGGITYTLTATNLGPDPAPGTTVENVLPAGATFVKATTAAGSCAGSTTLTCALGTLARGASVAVNVSATLGLAGTATDVASARAATTDTTPADNQTSILASVLAPVVVAPIVPLAPVAPVLSHVAISPARFGVGRAPTAVTASVRTPRGTAIGFTLNERARVRIVVQRKLSGRRHGRRCLAPTRGRRQRGPRCTRLVLVGTLTRTGASGANRVAFSGRVGSRALGTGSYIATLTASVTGAPSSVPARAGFAIVGR